MARSRQLLLFAVLALLAFLPYLPTLENDFLPTWDDGRYVLQNYRIHQLAWDNIVDLFRLHPQRGQMPNAQYTPLVELSFMLECHFFGLAPGMFHLTNALLHVLNTLLVFLFVRRLTGLVGWAGWTAAFFAVHPLHVESVAWITERKDLLSAFFYLLAVVSYLRFLASAARRDYALAILAGICAFLAKPLAVTLPAVLLICALYQGRGWGRKTLGPLVPFAALSALGAFVTFYTHFTTSIARPDEVRAFGANLLVAARGVALYAEKFIWPFKLSAFYPVPETWQAFGPDYYAALAALLAGVGTLAYWAFHGRHRIVVFSGLFFLIALAPSSRLVPVGMRFLAADRFFYLPGIGFCLLLAAGLRSLSRKGGAVRAGALAGATMLCGLWAVATWERSKVWRDDETLWRNALAQYPDSAYILGGLAQALAPVDIETAGRYADRALAISSREGQTMLVKAFQHQRAGEYGACLDWLAKAEARSVSPAYVALMVGRTYSLMGNPAKAIEAYARVLSFEPQSTEYLGWIAISHLALGDEAAAVESLRNMRQIDVSLASLDRRLDEDSPRYARLSPLQRAICLSPDLLRYQYELAQNSQFVLKDKSRAMREYGLLLAYYPAIVDVWLELAEKLPRSRWPPQIGAVQNVHVRKVAVALYNHACLLAGRGETNAAAEALRQAFRYDSALERTAATDPDLAGMQDLPEFLETIRSTDAPESQPPVPAGKQEPQAPTTCRWTPWQVPLRSLTRAMISR